MFGHVVFPPDALFSHLLLYLQCFILLDKFDLMIKMSFKLLVD